MSKRKSSQFSNGDDTELTKRRRSEDDDIDLSQNPDFSVNELEGEVGIVESILLTNFMCHSKLDFKFNSNVNFVVGRNGSGKSAVLTALQLGLGGKAQATNRGNSVKSFIKSGRSAATIEIKLRNRGADAFKPQKYGKSIIVQRKIASEGGTRYALRNANGQVVSTKREELNHILDQFNIQVDNPVSVLTQDTSRNFLHSKQPSDKYKFFLKATHLENMKHDFVNANNHKRDAKIILEQKERSLPQLAQEVQDWEKKYKALGALKNAKAKVKSLRNEMAWSYVNVTKGSFDDALKTYKTEEKRNPKFTEKSNYWKDQLKTYEAQRKETEKKLRDLGKEVEDLEPKRAGLKTTKEKKKKQFKDVSGEERKVSQELAFRKRERKDIEDRILELRNGLAEEDIQRKKREREEKMAQLEETLKNLEATRKTTEHQQDQFASAVRKYKQEQMNLNGDQMAVNDRIKYKHSQLRQMEGARKDKMKRYGDNIPVILNKINEAHKRGMFREKPRGPIGSYITPKDQKWALAIEQCLKGLAFSFCVDNIQDMKQLQLIFEKTGGRKPTIISSKFLTRIHDVSSHRARSRYPSMLDIIDVEDPVIANALIDQRSVENVIFIENTAEARKVMSADRPPPNVKEAFALNGDQMYCQPTYRYYSAPNSAKPKLLTSDIEQDILAVKEEIVNWQEELQQYQQQAQGLESNIKENQKNERSSQTRIMKLKEQADRVYNELRDLKNIEDPAPVNVSALEDEVAHFTEQIDRLQTTKDALKDQMANIQAEVTEADRNFHELADKITELANSSDPINERLTKYDERIAEAKTNSKHYQAKLSDHSGKVEEARQKYEEMKKNYEEDVQKATIICPEIIETDRTPTHLQKEIEQLLKDIHSEENSQGGKAEEITEQYYSTQKKLKSIQEEISQFRSFLKELEKILKKRQSQYLEFRRMIALRTNTYFMITLNSRNYNGKLDFNHTKELLDLVVHTQKNADHTHKDVKALSGGERSFSTVCFILALWEAMESPFRCLDEFDVFMDMVNRRISMDLMMQIAKNQRGRQFIFLTPLDMSQVEQDLHVSVYRMPDPDRGLGVLPFGERQDEEEQ